MRDRREGKRSRGDDEGEGDDEGDDDGGATPSSARRIARARDDDDDDEDEDDDEDDDTDEAEAWYARVLDDGTLSPYGLIPQGLRDVLNEAFFPSRNFPAATGVTRLDDVVKCGISESCFDGDTCRSDLIARGFHGGDAEKILRECRDENNAPYDEQTISGMMEDLMERGKTIHAPFCFTRGALALKLAVLKYCAARDSHPRYSECEIGVYVSRAGGDVAEWHTDTNDNFTIQLSGSKLWELGRCIERSSDGSMTSNSSLTDEPRCGIDYHTREQGGKFVPFARNVNASGIIPTGTGHDWKRGVRAPERCILREGDCLATQAGQYHRVSPIGKGLSVSVNVRLTPYQRYVWKSELYFLRKSSNADIIDITSMDELALRPRLRAFHVKHSDGLVLGLKLAPSPKGSNVKKEAPGEYYMNPMCACSAARTADGCVINIKCTSALTNKEYMNEFNLYVAVGNRDSDCKDLCDVFESPIAFNYYAAQPGQHSRARDLIDAVSKTLRDMNVVINTQDVSEGCAYFLKMFHNATRVDDYIEQYDK